MEVRLHPFLTSLLHGGVVSLSLQPHHPWEKRPWCVLYERLRGTWSVNGDKTNIPLLSITNQILVTQDTASHFTNGSLYKSYKKTYFYIRSSCTQEWFHAVVKHFYLLSNVVGVFKAGNWSSLGNFLKSKMILRSRMMQNGPCCCPLLAHCISVIVSAVQTAMAM